MRHDITKEKLLDLYIEKQLSSIVIAKELNTTSKTIINKLNKFNIPVRSHDFKYKVRKLPRKNDLLKLYKPKIFGVKKVSDCFPGIDYKIIKNLLIKYKIYNPKIKTLNYNHNIENKIVPNWYLYRIIYRGTKTMNLEFSIDINYLQKLYSLQNAKCSLSGLSIYFGTNSKSNDQTASLDRIDSSKGYIEGNLQWVHKKINLMKRTMSDEEFINICKLVAENIKEK